MFLLSHPNEEAIRRLIADQSRREFSYPEVGASREGAPTGYTVDHNRVRLGTGVDAWNRAVEGIRQWQMFPKKWLTLCWPSVPIQPNSVVALVIHHFGFFSLNACRIVYMIDDSTDNARRFGFAYGTLPEHGERGEERFSVEWRCSDDSVWYDIFAFSRPNHLLARMVPPLARSLQKKFIRESKAAMLAWVGH